MRKSWRDLGRIGQRDLGNPWEILGGLGKVLGSLGDVLRGLEGVLGESWAQEQGLGSKL